MLPAVYDRRTLIEDAVQLFVQNHLGKLPLHRLKGQGNDVGHVRNLVSQSWEWVGVRHGVGVVGT